MLQSLNFRCGKDKMKKYEQAEIADNEGMI